jgi:hypothetical protein
VRHGQAHVVNMADGERWASMVGGGLLAVCGLSFAGKVRRVSVRLPRPLWGLKL